MYSVVFYVPEENLETVKEALFAAGAGKIGDYQRCAWQVQGTGQFCPMPGADPYIGTVDKLEKVNEYKVEMVCEEQNILAVLQALKKAHPYEEPAYFVTKAMDINDFMK